MNIKLNIYLTFKTNEDTDVKHKLKQLENKDKIYTCIFSIKVKLHVYVFIML